MTSRPDEIRIETANTLRRAASTLEETELNMHEIARRSSGPVAARCEETANRLSRNAAHSQAQAEKLDPLH